MNPLQHTARWLAQHAGFPARRLPEAAERLLCLAALAAVTEDSAATGPKLFERRVGPQTASQKAHAMRRSRVHFKTDNSAKV
ncbi:MAG: hypothetical protein KIT44_04300 [Opitutaceae bacterium]|nr:hypothetical protein [Opitutaceae bacterium]